MQATWLRHAVMAGLVMIIVLMGIGFLAGRGLVRYERDAYERGARLAAVYFGCRGAFPSPRYLERAFTWGDPTSCAEVDKADEPKKPMR